MQPVFEPPKTEEPKTKRGEDISNAQLSSLLDEVSDGKKSALDFSKYMCDNLDIPVIYDGSKYSFSAFCLMLRKMKKVKQIIATPYKNSNNCITSMVVEVKKKNKILGVF